MWKSFNSLAQKAAEKAKAVAADLEGHLDKSVGIEVGTITSAGGSVDNATVPAENSADFALDDDDDNNNNNGENVWNDGFPMDDDLHTTAVTGGPSSTLPPETPAGTITTEAMDFFDDGFDAAYTCEQKAPPATTPHPNDNTAGIYSTTPQLQTQEEPIAPSPFDASAAQATTNDDDDDDLLVEKSTVLMSEGGVVEPKTSHLVQAATVPETTDPSNQSADASLEEPGTTAESEEVSAAAAVPLQPESQDSTTSSPQEEQVPLRIIQEKSTDVVEAQLPIEESQPELNTNRATAISNSSGNETTAGSRNHDDAVVIRLQKEMTILQNQLRQREEQLIKKNEQMASLQSLLESEKQELEMRVEQTKEEAKRRLAKAKESVEAAQKRAAAASSSSNETAAQKDEIIAALREEGQKLAHKQSEMERAVRTAKSEAREWREQVAAEQDAKNNALEKIARLEYELKSTKTDLAAARRGESQASKLEMDLQSSREESERKAATIMSLEQQVKELKAGSREVQKELDAARKGAVIESEREQKKLMKEYTSAMEDLEIKLRTTEKEAAVREDALRHEVTELRKRWQDAVRRADSLSMDVQSSTAPLLRQLESMERQNRARAAGWMALETKLRQELEDAVVMTEQLQKERNELRSKYQRLERQHKEMETEFRTLQNHDEEQTKQVQSLGKKMAELEAAHAERQHEWDEIQKMANEGVAKVRSEMTQTVVEAEERHVSQIEALKHELKQERDKRHQLENQVQGLLDQATSMMIPDNGGSSSTMALPHRLPQKKLSSGQGQAEILAGMSLGDDDESDGERDGSGRNSDDDDDDDLLKNMNGSGGGSSFAVLEGLQSRLKVAKEELNMLRKSLAESEKTREQLVTELAESRNAKEKLPLFEAKVRELSIENEQMKLEIQGLQEDIADVRELYRSQLNVLLEEKATLATDEMNGGASNHECEGSQPRESGPETT